ncbi:hypothetical protein SVAN01_08688 [Stagonosporopsis vannaccii]|nr:hypothetical protein SVAN01_08688 [Stagonosporopsis vannaccii]
MSLQAQENNPQCETRRNGVVDAFGCRVSQVDIAIAAPSASHRTGIASASKEPDEPIPLSRDVLTLIFL